MALNNDRRAILFLTSAISNQWSCPLSRNDVDLAGGFREKAIVLVRLGFMLENYARRHIEIFDSREDLQTILKTVYSLYFL